MKIIVKHSIIVIIICYMDHIIQVKQMEKKLSLENLTMLLQAAARIRDAGNRQLRAGDAASVSIGKLSMIQDTLHIISEYIPENQRLPFTNALSSCNSYCSTYCSLKKHLREIKGKNPDVNQLLTTLKSIMPMLENHQTVPLRKAVAIIEAIRS